ncbi:BglG family transcription antiterminator [Paenibacillus abyssi]|uniref:Transcriptional regulator MtlR n=1 Tax=Paenibacillus abyssi TaxID=1340531 RepID=A0A917D235_9BACL|nr:BglG family transcription antiterminator [Paenibacillus abyssi]GGG08055.1 transcriptional regulator MtlR [Paenibacillus abyssi]
MNISSRSRQILELLLHSDRELTAAQIAAEIHVSSRTVHRELAAVEDILHKQGIQLLKKAGSGIRLQGDEAELEKLSRLISTAEGIDFSPAERQLYLLCLLLESAEPVKLYTLGHELKVTIPTVSSDLDELDGWIRKFGVTLTRKRGYGVELTGSEEKLRETLRQLIRMRLDDTELIASRDKQPLHPLDHKLFELAGKAEMDDIETILWDWEERWAGRLTEDAYTELLIRLSIALRRIRSGKTVASNPAARRTSMASLKESDVIRLTGLLSERMGQALSPEETIYISGLLSAAQADELSMLPGDDLALTSKVRSLIEHVQIATGADFSMDHSLREGLFYHMKDALQRLADGLSIRNPLLDQIKKDFETLFGIVREAAHDVLEDVVVPDEVIGYLVMHFEASLERHKQLRRDVRAILVCSSGIGSAKLLQLRLQKELPLIQIVGRVSWYEASRIAKDKYDLMISTMDLPFDSGNYIKVSPLLTQEETERLRSFIRTVLEQKRNDVFPAEERGASEVPVFAKLLSLKITLDEMVNLIERFEIVQIRESSGELALILEEACRYEEERGVLRDAPLIAQRLMQREQSGSQMIPGTSVALFHTRSQEVSRASLSLYRLESPLTIETEPPWRLSEFLLMLAPQTLSREVLEVLSEISAMLLNDEMIELLEVGGEMEIRNYLTVHLKTFFNTKTEASEME